MVSLLSNLKREVGCSSLCGRDVRGLKRGFHKGPQKALRSVVPAFPREERVYTTTVGPVLFLGLSHDPRVTEQKRLWCVPFPWTNKGKGQNAIGPKERRENIIEASDPEKKNEGFCDGGVYFLLPCFCGAEKSFWYLL